MEDNLQQDYTSISPEIIKQVIGSKRIAIIGNQGAGKTTLAIKLAEIIGLDYVERLIFWKGNKMTQADIQDVQERMSLRENWIIDGDFGLLEFAETVILLDFPLLLCLWRAGKRSFNNILAWNFGSLKIYQQIPGKIMERLRFFTEVYKYPSKSQKTHVAKFEVLAEKQNQIVMKSPKEVEIFLQALESQKSRT
jgi:adenylate kinase family enzyme